MLPQYPVQIPIEVKPGDSITASLKCIANCSSKKQVWTLSMVNNSTPQPSWSANFTYGSSELSAVWIEEAPYSGGVLPLADFGTVTFETNSSPPSTLDLSTNGIQMTDPWGQTAIPSPSNGSSFDVCWENGTKIPCP